MTIARRRPGLGADRALRVSLLAVLSAGALLSAPPALPALAAEMPARTNGLVAFSSGGDIWVAEPTADGEARVLIGGTDTDLAPSWSPDGTRIAFVRDRGSVMVANADGSAVRLLWDGDPDQWTNGPEEAVLEWSPDGSTLLVYGFQARSVWLVPVDGGGAPVRAVPVEADWAAWWPDGSGFIVRGIHGRSGDKVPIVDLVPISWPDLVTGPPIIRADPDNPAYGDWDFVYLGQPAFSPDGRWIVVVHRPEDKALRLSPSLLSRRRAYLLAADGSDVLMVEFDAASDAEWGPVFSPDGSRLAILAVGAEDASGPGTPSELIAILTLDGSEPPVGFAAPSEDISALLWSPDGTSLLAVDDAGGASLVDAATGAQTRLPWSAGASDGTFQRSDWQRRPG